MMVVWLTMYMVQNPPKYDDVICEQPLIVSPHHQHWSSELGIFRCIAMIKFFWEHLLGKLSKKNRRNIWKIPPQTYGKFYMFRRFFLKPPLHTYSSCHKSSIFCFAQLLLQNTPYMCNLTKFWLRYLRLKTHDTILLFSWVLICWRWKQFVPKFFLFTIKGTNINKNNP